MKTFSQLAKDAIAILTRIEAAKEPTRSQLLYAAKQALRRDGERNPPARLYLPLMQAIESQLANQFVGQLEDALGIVVESEEEATERTQVIADWTWCSQCGSAHDSDVHVGKEPR